jgi:hypothetical protein
VRDPARAATGRPHASGERTNGDEHSTFGSSPPPAPRSTSAFSSTIAVYCDSALSSALPLSTTSASYFLAYSRSARIFEAAGR